jgi:hypothetical protein
VGGSARDWPGTLAGDLTPGGTVHLHLVLSNAGPAPLVEIGWELVLVRP